MINSSDFQSNLEISDFSDNVNDTISNIKVSLQKSFKDYKLTANKMKNINNNNKQSFTQKEKLKNYFNSIKHKSKLNISNISSKDINNNSITNDVNNKNEFVIYEAFKNMINNKNTNIDLPTKYDTVQKETYINNNQYNNNNQYITTQTTNQIQSYNSNNIQLPKNNIQQIAPQTYNQIPFNPPNNSNFYTQPLKEEKILYQLNRNPHKYNEKEYSPIVSQIDRQTASDNIYTEVEQNSIINDINTLNTLNINKQTYILEKVNSFTMTKESTKKKKNIYKKKYHKLNQTFKNMKLKYLKERKVTEILNMKLEYENKNNKLEEYKQMNLLLFQQLEENNTFLNDLENQLKEKQNIINQQYKIINEQKDIIKNLSNAFN